MERCLKKLVLEAWATGFQDPEKGGWEPVGPSGRKTVPGGLDWRQPGVYLQPGQKTNSGSMTKESIMKHPITWILQVTAGLYWRLPSIRIRGSL